MASRELIRLTESSRACENSYKAPSRRYRNFADTIGRAAAVGPKESIGTSTRPTTFDSAYDKVKISEKRTTTVKRKKSDASYG